MAKHTTQLRDLFRCLDDYPLVMLQALARVWLVDPHTSDSRELIERLIVAMQTPALVSSVVQTLNPLAYQALLILERTPEGIPSHRLVVTFGQIRKLGPARIEREEPWRNPQSPLEELYYCGMVYRAYGTIGGYYGEVLWIPQELASTLASLANVQSTVASEELQVPLSITTNENAMCEDIVAILVRLKRIKIPRDKRHTRQHTLPWDELSLQARMQGTLQPERLVLLQELIWRMQLLTESDGSLVPSVRARNWMRQSPARRMAALYVAWRDNPQWNELQHLTGVRIDTHAPIGIIEARRALCTELAAYPPVEWTRIDSLISALKNTHPDFLRADGDYDAWTVQNTHNNQPLGGFAGWDSVEGALVRHLVLMPFYWLGIVNLGTSEGTEQVDLFELTQQGWDVMNHNPSKLSLPVQPAVPASIGDDFVVTLPVQGTLYERYQLERLAEWLSQDSLARYKITEETIWESINSGISIEQVRRFLERISEGKVSPIVIRALHAWGGRFGRVTLQTVVTMQVADAALMTQLLEEPSLRRLLGAEVSPTQRLVPTANVPLLVQRMKALGIWPSLRL
ncbi:MAG: helicase-associated domain-containing protein [Anaerolineae bacterium]